jgi:hypothetical protein
VPRSSPDRDFGPPAAARAEELLGLTVDSIFNVGLIIQAAIDLTERRPQDLIRVMPAKGDRPQAIFVADRAVRPYLGGSCCDMVAG